MNIPSGPEPTHVSKPDDILDAALVLFAERGFHGTSVPDLAAAAGVGAGTIYRHFESKEGVVNALYRRWKEALVQEVFEVPVEGSWRQRVRALWGALFAFHAAHPHAVPFLDLHHHSDYLDAASRDVEQRSAVAWLQLFMDGQREEALVDLNPAAAIAMAYGAFLGLVRGAQSGYYLLDDAMIDASFTQVWAMLRR
jgi:TetR/AcrR family transcriptional regulator, repressor of fatR-cypB operon